MHNTEEIKSRLKFYNTGATQEPTLIVGHLDGKNHPDAGFSELVYFINAGNAAHDIRTAELQNK